VALAGSQLRRAKSLLTPRAGERDGRRSAGPSFTAHAFPSLLAFAAFDSASFATLAVARFTLPIAARDNQG
jgi:hypothetical protein